MHCKGCSHEVFDYPVEFGSLVSKAEVGAVFGFSSSQGTEVLDSFGYGLESDNLLKMWVHDK
jgi:hypothetical protein